ncbi:MAG: type II toxin-antitoxin system Phd/YefM family antitoxin [Erysipelotrichaceae bacterium]|nr:type II toxin-antitoxin system Phd/YefM family antitoxin [Erysipelotrichaceae bacterium]MBQ2685432.1 type II toxin-antitoxin system Phd/YefM family antitoxin [Erysipelotrichaceae bacterium]
MLVDTRNIVSMTDANQNFSKVARLVDQNGSAVIMKNNRPRYLIVNFEETDSIQMASDTDVSVVSKRLIKQNRKAYEELAK